MQMLVNDAIELFLPEFALKYRVRATFIEEIRWAPVYGARGKGRQFYPADGVECEAQHHRKFWGHSILLSEKFIQTEQQLLNAIAHELVHAWQMERLPGNYRREWNRLSHGARDYFPQWGVYLKQQYGVEI